MFNLQILIILKKFEQGENFIVRVSMKIALFWSEGIYLWRKWNVTEQDLFTS